VFIPGIDLHRDASNVRRSRSTEPRDFITVAIMRQNDRQRLFSVHRDGDRDGSDDASMLKKDKMPLATFSEELEGI
jgi:hypothetical protein